MKKFCYHLNRHTKRNLTNCKLRQQSFILKAQNNMAVLNDKKARYRAKISTLRENWKVIRKLNPAVALKVITFNNLNHIIIMLWKVNQITAQFQIINITTWTIKNSSTSSRYHRFLIFSHSFQIWDYKGQNPFWMKSLKSWMTVSTFQIGAKEQILTNGLTNFWPHQAKSTRSFRNHRLNILPASQKIWFILIRLITELKIPKRKSQLLSWQLKQFEKKLYKSK